ncbi:MAG: GntR family transcriptional regulator [Desulfitobacteriia bacterium]
MSSIIRSTPYHLQVYDIIKQKILSGELERGERIYENKLSQVLGVSRSPIREALRMLEQDEFLVVNDSGLIVNPMDFQDMEEIYQCRMAVEPFAAKLAVGAINQERIRELQECVDKAKEYHVKKQFNKVIEANTCFHSLIVVDCGNKRLKGFIEKISSLAILSRVSEFQCYHRDEVYLEEHQAVVDALKDRNENLVEDRLRNHINNDLKFFKMMHKKNSN